ncbi:hypothetical protein HDU93_000526 [Gonapodya sp. JEL0774]|nr:hypothetical protein HDU93_000526 [Gonapodya sp. JEL0774]
MDDETWQVVEVMEFCRDGTVASILKHGKIRTQGEVDCIFVQLLVCLEYMHEHGIAHNDWKLENLVWEPNHKLVKVIDFGLAYRFRDDAGNVKLRKGLAGSRHYLAPEQWTGAPWNPVQVDIWMMAVVYICLCMRGKFPWAASAMSEPGYSKWAKKGVFDKEILSRLPPQSIPILTSMLSIDPTQRPSAAKLLEEPWIRSISCCAKRAAREAGFSVEDKKYMPKGLFKTGTMMPPMVPDAAEGGGDAGSGGQVPSPAQLGKPKLTRVYLMMEMGFAVRLRSATTVLKVKTTPMNPKIIALRKARNAGSWPAPGIRMNIRRRLLEANQELERERAAELEAGTAAGGSEKEAHGGGNDNTLGRVRFADPLVTATYESEELEDWSGEESMTGELGLRIENDSAMLSTVPTSESPVHCGEHDDQRSAIAMRQKEQEKQTGQSAGSPNIKSPAVADLPASTTKCIRRRQGRGKYDQNIPQPSVASPPCSSSVRSPAEKRKRTDLSATTPKNTDPPTLIEAFDVEKDQSEEIFGHVVIDQDLETNRFKRQRI